MKMKRKTSFFMVALLVIIALNTNEANAAVSIAPQISIVDMGGGSGSRVELDWKVPCWYGGTSCAIP